MVDQKHFKRVSDYTKGKSRRTCLLQYSDRLNVDTKSMLHIWRKISNHKNYLIWRQDWGVELKNQRTIWNDERSSVNCEKVEGELKEMKYIKDGTCYWVEDVMKKEEGVGG